MIYPKFLDNKSTIGICAPSSGVGHKLDKYKKSLDNLKSNGFYIRETKSVRNNNPRSTTAKNRAKELDELICNSKVDMVLTAAGGDYMAEILPFINFKHIKENPKWLCGMSDPTNLLFLVTTNLDIATMYGHNAGSFNELTKSKEVAIDYFKGNTKTQKSYKRYTSFLDENITYPVKWISKKECTFKGRLIGGCIDVISKLIGTKYDNVNNFIDKYKDDGIIWYFDIFSMSSYDFYLTLLQFKEAGWFRYTKGILVSRVAFPTVLDKKLGYTKALDKVFKNIPHISEVDIGHVDPTMTFINGAIATVSYKGGKGIVKQELS